MRQVRGEPGQSFREVLLHAIGDDPEAKAAVARALGISPEGVHMALHRQRRAGGTAGMDEDSLRRIANAAGLDVVLLLVPKEST